jgi:hypothetical protein
MLLWTSAMSWMEQFIVLLIGFPSGAPIPNPTKQQPITKIPSSNLVIAISPAWLIPKDEASTGLLQSFPQVVTAV